MTEEDRPEQVHKLIQYLLESGFEPPLYWVEVGVNGAMIYMKMTQRVDDSGLDCEIISEHYPDGEAVGVKMPVNLMVCDRTGRATSSAELQQEETSD